MPLSQQDVAALGALVGAVASAAVVGTTNRNANKRNQYAAIAALVGAVGGGAVGYGIAPYICKQTDPLRKKIYSNKALYEGIKPRPNNVDENGNGPGLNGEDGHWIEQTEDYGPSLGWSFYPSLPDDPSAQP
jgi:hypothetical protein